MRTIYLLSLALLTCSCSREKPAPAAERAAPTAPEVAAPAKPIAAPEAPPATPEIAAATWLRALGKNDPKALAETSALPFEAGGLLLNNEHCPRMSARAANAAELTTLAGCLARDSLIASDAKRIDDSGLATTSLLEGTAVPEALADHAALINALRGEATWVLVNIAGDGQSLTFLLAVKDGRVRAALVEGEPDAG
jgi:hypothetical protein